MWHRKKRRRLGVTTPHRKALLRNLVRGLAMHRQIETTLSRAKETSRLADQMVTLAKERTLAARRQLIRRLGSSETAKLFMDEIAPKLQERNGGYTRVLKLGTRRGDGAERALVEFSVPIEMPAREERAKKAKPPALRADRPGGKEKPGKETPEKKPAKPRPEKPAAPKEEAAQKEETQKRGGFLSKLRKFLTGDEENK